MSRWYETLGASNLSLDPDDLHGVNPATGLPMINDAIDAGGNPFGSDLSDHDFGYDTFGTSNSFDIGGIGSEW